jgi:FAD:protein FMN transferase
LDKPRIRCHRSVRLDLGGIAKGFAVDRAVESLMAAGASAGSVNAGGDFRIFGAANEPLLVRDPAAPHRILQVGTIQTGAVATSSGYFRRRWKDSQPLAPYIDGRTGEILDLRDSVTVFAVSCTWADALTKVLALDWRTGAALLDRFQARALLLRASDGASSQQIFPRAPEHNLGLHPETL